MSINLSSCFDRLAELREALEDCVDRPDDRNKATLWDAVEELRDQIYSATDYQAQEPGDWGGRGMSDEIKSRPGEFSEAAKNAFDGAENSIAEDVVDRFRDAFAVLVRGKTVRRHLYLSLAAAERALNRAEAHGDEATMILVRLVPVVGGEAA